MWKKLIPVLVVLVLMPRLGNGQENKAVLDGVVAIVDALAVEVGVGVCDALGVEPPHPTTMRRIRAKAAPLARTR